jgi:two-component system NtrC family sensor kinase
VRRLESEVSERQHAEDALRASERSYREIYNATNEAIFIHDASTGAILDVNQTMCEMFGYTQEEASHLTVGDFSSGEPPYSDESAREWVARAFKEGPQLFEWRAKRKNGELFWDETNLKRATIGGKDCILAVVRDITERKRGEMALSESERRYRQQQQNLIQADKMATLGVLVSGVAHEINNPNNFIILNSDNLSDIWKDLRPILQKYREQYGDFMLAGLHFDEIREEIQPLISGISEGANRIRNIVQNLKDFARQEPGDMNQMVRINAVVDAATLILGSLIKKSTDRFSFESGSGIPPVKGAFQKIEQVVINLISNACQVLTARNQGVSVTTSYARERGRVIVTVKDEGAGISPENLKHIMTPFFTTKRDSGGTGLGLAISYNIIKDHGGDLSFESEPGKGTIATVSLPAAE